MQNKRTTDPSGAVIHENNREVHTPQNEPLVGLDVGKRNLMAASVFFLAYMSNLTFNQADSTAAYTEINGMLKAWVSPSRPLFLHQRSIMDLTPPRLITYWIDYTRHRDTIIAHIYTGSYRQGKPKTPAFEK
jgi:hypothetical protein